MSTFDVDFSSLNDQAFINAAIATHETTIANHDDVTITSPSDGDFLRYNGTNWIVYKDLKELVEDDNGLINQSTSYEEYLKLSFIVPEDGIYRLFFRYTWSLNSTGDDFIARLQLDDTTNLVEFVTEPQDAGGTGVTLPIVGGGSTSTGTNQRFTKTGLEMLTLTAGSHFIDLDWRCSASNTEATIYKAQLTIERWD